EDFCATAKDAGVRPVVVFIPILDDLKAGKIHAVQRVKREVCDRLGIPFVDFTDDLKQDPDRFYLEADPVHLNVAGNEVVARRLAERLAPLLPR
ncbi:MAG: hypothetical protein JNL97_16450, partial [Verrucomicrobiales bacterium]|nr:hypothetical protein [Verrucomicrobiales bacterium]